MARAMTKTEIVEYWKDVSYSTGHLWGETAQWIMEVVEKAKNRDEAVKTLKKEGYEDKRSEYYLEKAIKQLKGKRFDEVE